MPTPTEDIPTPLTNAERSLFADVSVEPATPGDSDNLCIALASYFSKHMDRPSIDTDDTELGWGAWVMAKTTEALDAIASVHFTKVRQLERELAAANAKLAKAETDLQDSISKHYETHKAMQAAEARAKELEAHIADPAYLHAYCLRALSADQIAHLFGDKMQADLIGLREQVALLRDALKRCAQERGSLISGAAHATTMIGEIIDEHFDEDPGEGRSYCPEGRKLRDLRAHIEGGCIRTDGEYMGGGDYNAALAATPEGIASELADLREDRARYHFLRDHVTETVAEKLAAFACNPATPRDQVDAAIDAVRKGGAS